MTMIGGRPMYRRRLLEAGAAGLAALAVPRVGRAADAGVLKFVPQADLASLDPMWTTSYVTRNHGYMVYDTLYGLDEQYRDCLEIGGQAAIATGGHKSLAGRNFCPKPEPSVPL